MYYRDLSKLQNCESCNIFNVGFLDPGKNFVIGAVDPSLVAKLVRMGQWEQINMMRSYPQCFLVPCDGCRATIETGRQAESVIANNFLAYEIWVPAIDVSRVYVAPSEIMHYIQHHRYQPPYEFILAVLNFDTDSDWSGKTVENQFFDEHFAIR